MKLVGIIPARYASTRFPGKPLADIGGKPMIQRTYEQALKAKSLSKVVVATDDARIFKAVKNFGGEVIMTSPDHTSGTDRCAEAVTMLNLETATTPPLSYYGTKPKREAPFTAVINIQGDEPFIDPSQIDSVANILNKKKYNIATLAKKLSDLESILNPHVVKVVFTEGGKALYFSRSPIPYLRSTPQLEWASSGYFFKHIGIYGYTTAVLREITQLKTGHFEQLESLEQLRWLENGYTIGVAETDLETIGIDTPEDLLRLT
jgi:3-deoxy-manno-octulosonate cytidylyltransferase (CMP-KDO synthetase)